METGDLKRIILILSAIIVILIGILIFGGVYINFLNTQLTAALNAENTFTSSVYGLSITSPIDGGLYNLIQPVLKYVPGNVTDLCWYSTDNGNTNSSAGYCAGNFTINSLEGDNSWTVYEKDPLGNIGSAITNFNVDTTSPQLTITNPKNGTTVGGSQIIQFTDNELTGPVCSVDGTLWYPCSIAGTTTLGSIPGFNYTGSGNSFALYVSDTDNAGNFGITSINLTEQ